MQHVLIFGGSGTGLKTLVKAIAKINSSVEVIAVTSTNSQSIMEGTFANDQPFVEEYTITDPYKDLRGKIMALKYEPERIFHEEKEKFYVKNQVLKSVPTIKNHRIQTRNTLPQRIRINEKPQS